MPRPELLAAACKLCCFDVQASIIVFSCCSQAAPPSSRAYLAYAHLPRTQPRSVSCKPGLASFLLDRYLVAKRYPAAGCSNCLVPIRTLSLTRIAWFQVAVRSSRQAAGWQVHKPATGLAPTVSAGPPPNRYWALRVRIHVFSLFPLSSKRGTLWSGCQLEALPSKPGSSKQLLQSAGAARTASDPPSPAPLGEQCWQNELSFPGALEFWALSVGKCGPRGLCSTHWAALSFARQLSATDRCATASPSAVQ